ncbi:MAG: hypothetical protein ACRDP3_00770 [Streptomyces sp.]|uniref:hypothetical protein n=1 Tax=Streptomyces sp. TaxID=1931 RepID=UPI003D6B5C06
MAVGDEPRVHEIRVSGCADVAELLALQEPIARALCPEPEHSGPCDVPWEFSYGDDEPPVLLLGIYTSGARAAEVTDRVRTVIGEARSAVLGEGNPERFKVLVEQYRIEHG